MTLAFPPFRPGALLRALIVAAIPAFSAAGCDTLIEGYRDLNGIAKNDPDPTATANTANLRGGEAADYPNLATVPPPPTYATSKAERDRLLQGLVAERAGGKTADQRIRAGDATAAAPAPALPGTAAAPLPRSGRAEDGSFQPPVAIAGAPDLSPGAPAPKLGLNRPDDPTRGPRKPGQVPDAAPQESTLDMPQPRSAPLPDQARASPPPPSLAAVAPPLPSSPVPAVPMPPGTAPAAASVPATPAAPAIAAPSVTAMIPPAAAPPPTLAEPATARQQTQRAGSRRPVPSVSTQLAAIDFAGDATTLTASDRLTLDRILPAWQQNPGTIRIVSYGGVGPGTDAVAQLNTYRAALDRGQAITTALTRLGIPADKIQVEASPTASPSGVARAELRLEY